jgi:hypothetical protein
MDVRVLKSQNIFYKIDSGVAALLIDAGICEQFVPAPKPAIVPVEWSIARSQYSGKPLLRHSKNGTVTDFGGPVADAKTAFQQRQWDGTKYVMTGPVPPDAIVQQYKEVSDELLRR